MGIFDNLENMAMNRAAGSNPAVAEILQMIQNHPGGLNGLVQSFHQNGLGGLVNSWVGTGQNLPATSDQVQQVLGSDRIQALAQQIGVDPNTASSMVSQFLPMIVDKLTPNGTMPDHSNLLQMGENLLASLGKTGTNS